MSERDKTPLGPVIDATQRTFSMMLGATLGDAQVYAGDDGPSQIYEASAVIGFGGSAEGMKGSMILSCPEDVAKGLTRRLLGDDEVDDQAIADALGELVNVIGGSAKPGLRAQGHATLGLSLPTVVVGGGHRVFRKRGVKTWLAVFDSGEIGRVAVQISLDSMPTGDA